VRSALQEVVFSDRVSFPDSFPVARFAPQLPVEEPGNLKAQRCLFLVAQPSCFSRNFLRIADSDIVPLCLSLHNIFLPMKLKGQPTFLLLHFCCYVPLICSQVIFWICQLPNPNVYIGFFYNPSIALNSFFYKRLALIFKLST